MELQCTQVCAMVLLNETKQFVALSLLMGIVVKPEISDYWSTNPLLKGSIFNSVMSRNRFHSIIQFPHFAENSQFDPNDPDCDCLIQGQTCC